MFISLYADLINTQFYKNFMKRELNNNNNQQKNR